jgi:predicted  nucleic acid-binding Zn-ribbon protein
MSDVSRFDSFIKKAIEQKKASHKNVKQAFKDFSEYREQQSAAATPEKKPRKRKTKAKQPAEDFKDERPRNDGTKRSTSKSRSSASNDELASVQRRVPDDEPGDSGSDIANAR